MNPAMIQVMVALLTATAQLLTELARVKNDKQPTIEETIQERRRS